MSETEKGMRKSAYARIHAHAQTEREWEWEILIHRRAKYTLDQKKTIQQNVEFILYWELWERTMDMQANFNTHTDAHCDSHFIRNIFKWFWLIRILICLSHKSQCICSLNWKLESKISSGPSDGLFFATLPLLQLLYRLLFLRLLSPLNMNCFRRAIFRLMMMMMMFLMRLCPFLFSFLFSSLFYIVNLLNVTLEKLAF